MEFIPHKNKSGNLFRSFINRFILMDCLYSKQEYIKWYRLKNPMFFPVLPDGIDEK